MFDKKYQEKRSISDNYNITSLGVHHKTVSRLQSEWQNRHSFSLSDNHNQSRAWNRYLLVQFTTLD